MWGGSRHLTQHLALCLGGDESVMKDTEHGWRDERYGTRVGVGGGFPAPDEASRPRIRPNTAIALL